MLKQLKKQQKGFTIIEVMIVLAIAGLIILIVLLAVPALQRNSRNTAIKNDAAALAGAVSSFQSNSDGAAIATISGTGLVSSAVPAGGTAVTEQAKLQSGTTVTTALATAVSPHTAVVAHGTLAVWVGHNCQDIANTRANAVWYSIETTSAETAANNNKCVDS